MADKVSEGVQDARARLQDHFAEYKEDRYAEGWSRLWDQGDFLPWDKGLPNPALYDILDKRHDLIGTAIVDDSGSQRRKKALVPGCGRGVDVLLLASFGYDAYGLEVSPKAVDACEKEVRKTDSKYPVKDEKIGNGSVRFVQGDFFKDDWLATAAVEGKFDLIYDYTFFCALSPSLRPAWAQRMSQLLSPSPQGNLICLEFPTYKSPSTGGPPFGSPPKVYMEHLSAPGEEIPYDKNGEIKMDPLKRASKTGLERVAHWQPERTHQVGMDENGNVRDWVAVWRHRR